MFNVTTGQWWNAPADKRFAAYYMTLRVHYEMPASEALRTAKKNVAVYPDFFRDPLSTLHSAVNYTGQ